MIQKIALAIVGLFIPFSFVGVMVEPAQADTPGCVSDPEFNRADPGDRQVYVENDFDTTGWLVSTRFEPGWKYTIKQYVRCASAPGLKNRVNVEWRQNCLGGVCDGYTRLLRKWLSVE